MSVGVWTRKKSSTTANCCLFDVDSLFRVQIAVDFARLLVRSVAMECLRASNGILLMWYLYLTPLNCSLNHLP